MSFTSDAPVPAGDADVTVTIAGRFRSDENYRTQPRVLEREAVFIYTDGGSGRLVVEGAEHAVRPGEGFLLFPGHVHEYRTAERRWDIWWFHCTGGLISLLRKRSGRTYIPPTPFDDPAAILNPMKAIVREFQERPPHFEAVLSAYARIVLIELARMTERSARGDTGRGARLVQAAAAYLRENLDRTVSSAELEEQFHVSGRHLTRLFRQHAGETPRQYAIKEKLAEAKRLLYLTDLTVAEVAARLGFSDPHYFSRLFYLKTGITPTAYRRSASAWTQDGVP